jgi:hypothetical protein
MRDMLGGRHELDLWKLRGLVVALACLFIGLTTMFLNSPVATAIESDDVVLASDYPWVAYIFYPATKNLCTGALINPEWVLTAAHCIIDNAPDVEVTLGRSRVNESGGEIHKVTSVEKRGSESGATCYVFEPLCRNEDIALLRLTDYRSQIKPILIDPNNGMSESRVTVFGFGRSTSNPTNRGMLWKVDVNIEQCADGRDDIFCYNTNLSSDRRLFCETDSGGPVLARDSRSGNEYIVGVVNRPISRNSDGPCYNSAIFAQVAPVHNDWISGVINSSSASGMADLANMPPPVSSVAQSAPAIGPTVLSHPLTSPEIFSPTLPSPGACSTEATPEGYLIRVSAACDGSGRTTGPASLRVPVNDLVIRDGSIELEVKAVPGSNTPGVNVYSRSNDRNGYDVWVNFKDKQIWLSYLQNGGSHTLARWKDTENAIDWSDWVKVGIQFEGANISVTANGKNVIQATDGTYESGGFDVRVSRYPGTSGESAILLRGLLVANLPSGDVARASTYGGPNPVVSAQANPPPASSVAPSPCLTWDAYPGAGNPNLQGMIAAGAKADQAADTGGDPTAQARESRAAYLAIDPSGVVHANAAFVQSHTVAQIRQAKGYFLADDWQGAVNDGKVQQAIDALDAELGSPGCSGIVAARITGPGASDSVPTVASQPPAQPPIQATQSQPGPVNQPSTTTIASDPTDGDGNSVTQTRREGRTGNGSGSPSTTTNVDPRCEPLKLDRERCDSLLSVDTSDPGVISPSQPRPPTVPSASPSVPTNLRSRIVSNSTDGSLVEWSWDYSGPAVTEFRVGWIRPNEQPSATVGASARSYRVSNPLTGAGIGELRVFVVCAVNQAGSKCAWSQ